MIEEKVLPALPSAPPPPRGAAPFRWRGYPGVPLLGARRSIGGMVGAFVVCAIVLVLLVGVSSVALEQAALPSGLQALVQLVVYGLAYGSWLVVAGLGRKRVGVSFSEWVALRPFSRGLGVSVATGAMALALWFYLMFAAMVSAFGVQPPQQPSAIDVFPVTPLGMVVAFLAVVIIGPLAEEVLFRGVLFGGMRDRIGEGWAIIISSFLFAAAHASWFVLVPFFVFGVLLARITTQTRSVWPAFIAHALFNLNSLAFTYAAHFRGDLVAGWIASANDAIAVLLR